MLFGIFAGAGMLLAGYAQTTNLIKLVAKDAYTKGIVLPQLSRVFQNPAFHAQPVLPPTQRRLRRLYGSYAPVGRYSPCAGSFVEGNCSHSQSSFVKTGTEVPPMLLADMGLLGMPNGKPPLLQTNDWLTGGYCGNTFVTADVRMAPSLAAAQLMHWHSGQGIGSPQGYTGMNHRAKAGHGSTPLFSGRWVSFTGRVALQGSVLLWSKGFEDLGARQTIGRKGFARVGLENGQFNDTFDVFATDDHTAFRLLTPSVVEMLLGLAGGLAQNGAAKGVALGATGSTVGVLVSGAADAFEPATQLAENTEALSIARVQGEAAVITTVLNALSTLTP